MWLAAERAKTRGYGHRSPRLRISWYAATEASIRRAACLHRARVREHLCGCRGGCREAGTRARGRAAKLGLHTDAPKTNKLSAVVPHTLSLVVRAAPPRGCFGRPSAHPIVSCRLWAPQGLPYRAGAGAAATPWIFARPPRCTQFPPSQSRHTTNKQQHKQTQTNIKQHPGNPRTSLACFVSRSVRHCCYAMWYLGTGVNLMALQALSAPHNKTIVFVRGLGSDGDAQGASRKASGGGRRRIAPERGQQAQHVLQNMCECDSVLDLPLLVAGIANAKVWRRPSSASGSPRRSSF